MSGRRLPPAHGLLVALVTAATTWIALSSWRDFLMSPEEFLLPTTVLACVLVVSGSLLRWVGTPRIVVVAAQLGVGCVALTWQVTGSLTGFDELADALDVALVSARTYAAPVSDQVPPVTPLLLLGSAFFLVLMDTLVCTLHRAALAGLGLLAIYSVPSGLAAAGPSWVSFAGAALGFLVLLQLDARHRAQGWGQPLEETDPEQLPAGSSAPRRPARTVASAVRSGFGQIAVAAIALALVLPPFIPMLDTTLLGVGTGAGGGEITIRNPRADLRRDLERGLDIPLIRVTTDQLNPSYLRVAVLNRFTGNEWSSGDRDVSPEQNSDRELPPPDGLSPDVPRTTHQYQVEITDQFDSTWLPTQFPINEIHAGDGWRYDADTMDFLAVDDENAAGSSYTMTAIEPDYGTDGRWFANSPASDVDPEVLEVPGGIPSVVRGYAQEVTEGAVSDYERARMLQAWFRTEGGFEYNLQKAPKGSFGQTLEQFLSDQPGGRIGYCEQFAASMAIMARMVGIPARVAVGFLDSTAIGDGEYEYSSHDLHAWPELYFSGAGWVRFEPTPDSRAESAPNYSTVPVRTAPQVDPSGQPQPEPTDATGPGQQPAPTEVPDDPVNADADQDGSSADSGTPALLVWLGIGAGTVLLLVLAALPHVLRRRRRDQRLDGDAEALWSEVRATVIDLGTTWPEGRSPREIATVLRGRLHGTELPVDATDGTRPRSVTIALDELVLAVEQDRYARPTSTGGLAVAVVPRAPPRRR
ncbi:transglutaminase family protein [Nocardioides sambongensis]|uniref:transglutaminase family protein n=1 Tax=Nocardioides sambongensis TaxID=2589074 RepID=UPI00112A610C|nr:DUF3488 and transglutaminase-like domain-containing protein [Nocardioides sambongensis]